jgi:small-conductance mechanosensitive channel
MSENKKPFNKLINYGKRPIIITFIGTILMIILIIATIDISQRNIITFISTQQKYILSIESTILVFFIVEMLARLITLLSRTPEMIEHSTRLRLIIRIIGYTIGSLSVISILSSNATLGVSVGAIAGVVIAFATQSIVASILATVLILSTRMIKVGEEITINQMKGVVTEINLTHTILSIDDDVIFVPNSLVISSMVRRKRRNSSRPFADQSKI